jgi:ATP-binding cassette, subfamily B, bacterial MsbA
MNRSSLKKQKASGEDKGSSKNLIFRVVKENYRFYVKRYILAFILMAIVAACTGLTAFMMKNIVESVFGTPEKIISHQIEAGSFSWLLEFVDRTKAYMLDLFGSKPGLASIAYVSISIILVFTIKGIAQYYSSIILAKIGNNVVARQQRNITNHLLDQSLNFFIHFPSSDLITRVSLAANSARDVMNLLAGRVQDVLAALALLIAMFQLDWKLSCFAFLVLAPIIFGLSKIIRRIRKIAKTQYQTMIGVVSAIQESILGIKLIKSYNMESHMKVRAGNSISGVETLSNKMAVVSNRTSPLMECIGGLMIAGIVFYGGYRNLNSHQSASNLIAFLTAALLAYEPVKRLAKLNVSMETALIGVRMLYNVIDADYQINDIPNAPKLQLNKGEVELKNITFAYLLQNNVLHDVSLKCPAGKVTALVGRSGSGKTSILNLLERFYSIEHGSIFIDEQDTSQVQTESLRDAMSLVSQDTFLFSDTIRSNIRFARPSATDADIEKAAQAAFAHDFILQLPHGYDTHIGENGGSLSGGQRQRISIARAFLKDSPILLLDEATSALDSESEQQIQKAFDELMKDRTTIVIAHRFSTIRNAHVIHVMDRGRLVASGSHDELIADQQGMYSHLYSLQFADI